MAEMSAWLPLPLELQLAMALRPLRGIAGGHLGNEGAEMTDEEQGEKNAANLKREAEVMLVIADALKGLPAEAQSRILRALAVFFDVRVR